MRHARRLFLVAMIAAAAGISGATVAADGNLPLPSPDPHNIDGTWLVGRAPYDPIARTDYGATTRPPETPEMTPEGEVLFKAREDARRSGRPLMSTSVRCAPVGVTRLGFLGYPIQIVQTQGQIIVLFEHNRERQIVHMGRALPAIPPAPTWMGYSVGRWDGDTLVVETIAQRADGLLYPSLPQTEKTRITERIRKIDGGDRLEVIFTVDEPKYYRRPWTMRALWGWSPEPENRVLEAACEEADHPEDEAARAYH